MKQKGYAKLHGEILEPTPKNGYGYSNFNESIELLERYGYRPYYEEDKPNKGEGNYSWHFEEREDGIYKIWTFSSFTKNEIMEKRAQAYKDQTDELCSEYTRKSLLGTLTPEKKEEIEEALRKVSEDIAEKYPYPTEEEE